MRRLLLSAVLGALIALAGVWVWNGEPVSTSQTTAAAGLPLDAPPTTASSSVKIEHTLLTVTPRIEAHRRISATGAPQPVARQAPVPRKGLFARARRILVGTGQHRPEPFPRAH